VEADEVAVARRATPTTAPSRADHLCEMTRSLFTLMTLLSACALLAPTGAI
jgi:hypothetical protein